MIGDLGYLGFAFAASGIVSVPKLTGALFTLAAHILLLAYGDEQVRHIEDESGTISRFVLTLRTLAQNMVSGLPKKMASVLKAKPVGIPFLMLSINGLGLVTDALSRLAIGPNAAMWVQMLLGTSVTVGTCAFAAADFVRGQRAADCLTKVAPSILSLASVAIVILAVLTRNPFVFISVLAFTGSNCAGFFTRIEKEGGQHLHS